ncbi:hypothetical protein DQ238_03470 [Geodermatophilus sp. TF02-6]|uniref:hypothetical protein n=1 Tax=Geodermatophilus sp. TF02-6 TaxID=2250575 RepID=UPI000DE93AF3|nr:hypothetical protein [Geodermatophilus sp. TF02-6]RBY82371.1 hypothetical protein DQ238_03470 [Geodermatophilus sp. TF02-6]
MPRSSRRTASPEQTSTDPHTRGPSAGRWFRAVVVVAAAVFVIGLMVRLSLWQWGRARERGALLNYSYAVEWLVFAVLTTVGLVHLWRESRREQTRKPAPEHHPDGPLVGPPLAPGEELEEVTWVRLRRRMGLGRGGS